MWKDEMRLRTTSEDPYTSGNESPILIIGQLRLDVAIEEVVDVQNFSEHFE